jgi:small subunit ribosomal protein S17
MEKGKSSKTMIGRVVSDKPSKTVVVAVESRREHPIYENGAAHYGDIVEMIPTRPLSRTKNFRLLRVVTKGEVAESAELKEIT